VRVSR